MHTLSLKDVETMLVSVVKHNDKCADEGLPPSSRIVPFLASSPGIGKTAIVNKVGLATNRPVKTLIMAQYMPDELGGLIWPQDNRMRKLRPSYMPDEGKSILFLDEFSQAPQSVQNIGGQLIYEMRVGEHALPDHTSIFCAGNNLSDRAGTTTLVRQVGNRVCMIGVTLPAEDWINWASEKGLDPKVIGYIAWKKNEALNLFDAKNETNATARTWECTSNVMKLGLQKNIQYAMIAGYVGDSQATSFHHFLDVFSRLPDPEDIIKTPSTAPIPTKQDEIYATVSALMGHINNKTTAPIIQYLDRLERKEFCVFAIKYMAAKDKTLINNKAVTTWMAANAKLFF